MKRFFEYHRTIKYMWLCLTITLSTPSLLISQGWPIGGWLPITMYDWPPLRVDAELSELPECNENPYQVVFFDDFDEELDPLIWQKTSNNPSPFDRIHTSIYGYFSDDAVKTIDGLLHIEMRKEDITHEYTDTDGNAQEMDMNWIVGRVQSSKNSPGTDQAGGCFRFGKFSIRAKIPKGGQGVFPAYWFFGYAGEVDVFEFFDDDTDKMQTSVIDYEDNIGTLLSFTYSNDVDYAEDFHVYTFEWTPYKLAFFIDGVNYWNFYKYYTYNHHVEDGTFLNYLSVKSCEEGELLTSPELYKSNLFTNDGQYMDLIMNTGLRWNSLGDENPSPTNNPGANVDSDTPTFNEMLVDWVKVEQKIDYRLLNDENFICLGNSSTYSVEGDFAFLNPGGWYSGPRNFEWTLSDNIEITDISDDGRTITTTTLNEGVAEVSVLVPNVYSCHDLTLTKKTLIIDEITKPALEIITKPCLGTYILSVDPILQNLSSDYIEWSTSGLEITEFSPARIFIEKGDGTTGLFVLTLTITNPCTGEIHTYDYVINTEDDCDGIIKLIASPNPSNGFVDVSFDGLSQNTKLDIRLINQQFEVVKMKTEVLAGSGTSFDTSDLNDGFYHISAITDTGEEVLSVPITIQH